MLAANEPKKIKEIPDLIRKALQSLDFFESFLLLKNLYLLGNDITFADICLMGSMSVLFRFFFDEKIRMYSIPNIFAWFSNLLTINDPFRKVYRNFCFCKRSLDHGCAGGKDSLSTIAFLQLTAQPKTINLQNYKLFIVAKVKSGVIKQHNRFAGGQREFSVDRLILFGREVEPSFEANPKRIIEEHNPKKFNIWTIEWVDDIRRVPTKRKFKSLEDKIKDFPRSFVNTLMLANANIVCYVMVYVNCQKKKDFDFLSNEADQPLCPNHPSNEIKHIRAKGFLIKPDRHLPKSLEDMNKADDVLIELVKENQQKDFLIQFSESKGYFQEDKVSEDFTELDINDRHRV